MSDWLYSEHAQVLGFLMLGESVSETASLMDKSLSDTRFELLRLADCPALTPHLVRMIDKALEDKAANPAKGPARLQQHRVKRRYRPARIIIEQQHDVTALLMGDPPAGRQHEQTMNLSPYNEGLSQ